MNAKKSPVSMRVRAVPVHLREPQSLQRALEQMRSTK
jgi:hypothetical protein